MSIPNPLVDFAGSFMEDYFAECDEHLTIVRRGLLALEAAIGAADPPAAVVEELFRSFHSLKGISAMVELREAEQLAHEMESGLRSIKQGRVRLSERCVDALIEGVHCLDRVIAARRNGSEVPPIDDTIARLASAGRATAPAGAETEATPPADAAGNLWLVTFTPSVDLVARGVKVDSIRARLAQVGTVLSVTPRVAGEGAISFDFQLRTADDLPLPDWTADGVTAERLDQAAIAPQAPSAEPRPAPRPAEAAPAANFVRVDLARLDDLMRLVGDLVVSRARLEDALERIEPFTPAADWRTLQEHSGSIERHVRDLREGVMRVRLVPVGEIFRRMPFVVRDLARDHDKRIQLEVAGQDTEIDKFLIERMMDPILHLVRNAVSHGIEPPAERTAAGKRPEGTIRLSASTVGESVMLEVGDDGRGMDAEAVGRRARESGMDVPDGPVDARILLDVICSPGFSTRDAADRASGRGVGMSVVRETIYELGGTLDLETTRGEGTTFRILLPLTLAIADALIVHVGDRVFAVPQSAVREVAEVETGALRVIENNELVMHRGAALPVVRLARLFSLAPGSRQRLHLVVVGAGPSALGILVDRISGQREIVVKTLRDPLVRVPGVSGATELGDGRLVLIVDPAALARHHRGRALHST